MRSFQVVFLGSLMAFAYFFMFTNDVVAGEYNRRQEMKKACDENQSPGTERQKCYNRHKLGRAPIFPDEMRRWRDNHSNGYHHDEFHSEYYPQPHRYIGEGHPSNELGVIILGLGILGQLMDQANQPPPESCRLYYDEYGELIDEVCD